MSRNRKLAVNERNNGSADRVAHAFPAESGTFLLQIAVGADPLLIVRERVIGWAVSDAGLVDPITASGIDEMGSAILHPDGQVEDVMCLHDSYDTWRKSMEMESAEIALSTGATTG